MSCDVRFTEQERQDILDDQDHIAAIIMRELSIEIELAEMDWLSWDDLRSFLRSIRFHAGDNLGHQ